MKIICDWENCNETGSYKAPVEKDNSKKYRLLCLNHIKIFNKNWNYFENMNDQEIEFFIKSALIRVSIFISTIPNLTISLNLSCSVLLLVLELNPYLGTLF